jgi:hypothetical protein
MTGWPPPLAGGTDCSLVEAQQQDPCTSAPCLNGGQCTHQYYGAEMGYACNCPATAFGTHCESMALPSGGTAWANAGIDCCPAGGTLADVFNDCMCQCKSGLQATLGAACNRYEQTGQYVEGCAPGQSYTPSPSPGGQYTIPGLPPYVAGACPPFMPTCTAADTFKPRCSATLMSNCCCS